MDKLEAIFCSNNKNSTGRFIEAALLSLLEEEASYGYSLMEKLEIFGLDRESIDSSLVYRNLRSMEKRGLIHSDWQASTQGPRKRIYEITDLGRQSLKIWVDLLVSRKNTLESIINYYKRNK